MARIKIKDLPKTERVSREEMKKVMGGGEPGRLSFWVSNPLPIAPTVATAIAIPVAINDGDDEERESQP